jgi:hypothetical protein
VTRLRADQLPPKVRAQIETKRPRLSRAGVGLSVPCPGHCSCGEAFPTAAAWERHAKTTGHTRWSIDL